MYFCGCISLCFLFTGKDIHRPSFVWSYFSCATCWGNALVFVCFCVCVLSRPFLKRSGEETTKAAKAVGLLSNDSFSLIPSLSLAPTSLYLFGPLRVPLRLLISHPFTSFRSQSVTLYMYTSGSRVSSAGAFARLRSRRSPSSSRSRLEQPVETRI